MHNPINDSKFYSTATNAQSNKRFELQFNKGSKFNPINDSKFNSTVTIAQFNKRSKFNSTATNSQFKFKFSFAKFMNDPITTGHCGSVKDKETH